MIEIKLLQSADSKIYAEMFSWSNRITRLFCSTQSLNGDYYIGIRRGNQPWKASYNRVYMLKDLLDRGFRGWAIWLDADAYVKDIDFDIRKYLSQYDKRSLIVASSGASTEYWDVNSGILMLNFSRLFAQLLVMSWHSQINEISDDDYESARVWDSIPNDQDMLQKHLRDQTEDEVRREVHYEGWGLINSGYASFIRQVMRTPDDTIQHRTDTIRNDVIAILRASAQHVTSV